MNNVLATTVKAFEDGINIIEDAKTSIDNLSEAVVSIGDKMEELSMTNDFNKDKIIDIISGLEETANNQKNVLKMAQDTVLELKDDEKDTCKKITVIIESFVTYAEEMNNKLKDILNGMNFNSKDLNFSEIDELSKSIENKVKLFNSEISKIISINNEVENIKNSISVIDSLDIISKFNEIAEMINDVHDKTSEFNDVITDSDLKFKESSIVKNMSLIKEMFEAAVTEIETIYEKTKVIDDDYSNLNEKLSDIIKNKCSAIYQSLDKINSDNLSNSSLINSTINELKGITESILNNCLENKPLNEEILNITEVNRELSSEINEKSSAIIEKNDELYNKINDLNNGFTNNMNSLNIELDDKLNEIKNYNQDLNDYIKDVIDDKISSIKEELQSLKNDNSDLHNRVKELTNNSSYQNEQLNQLKKLNIELVNDIRNNQKINKDLLNNINDNNKVLNTLASTINIVVKEVGKCKDDIETIKLQNSAKSKNDEINSRHIIETLKIEMDKVYFTMEGLVNNLKGVSSSKQDNSRDNISSSHIQKGNISFHEGRYEEAYKEYRTGAEKNENACIEKIRKFEEFIFNKAKSNNIEFQYIAGKIEEDKKNYANAVKLYEQSGRKGHEQAKQSYIDLCTILSRKHPEFMERLGDAYYFGKIVSQDKETAKQYYMKAADAGSETAVEKLKLYYITLKNLKL